MPGAALGHAFAFAVPNRLVILKPSFCEICYEGSPQPS